MSKKSILDPSFKYVPANKTDLKKTFARIRREQAEASARKPKSRAPVFHIQSSRKQGGQS